MPRPEKVQAVAEIKERMQGARAVFLAEYAGLSVKDQQKLRRSLRAQGAEFKVVKMTLARRAAEELDLEGVGDWLLGPTGLTFADVDAVGAAKALKDFAKDHDVFMIKGGLLGDEVLTPERVGQLAEIEPRDVLLAKLAGAIKAPMANLAGLLAALPRNLASAMQQLVEKKDAAAPAAAAPAGTAPEPAAAPAVADLEGEPAAEAMERIEAAEEVATPAVADHEAEPAASATDSDQPSTEAEAPATTEPEVEQAASPTDSDEPSTEAEAPAAAEPEAAATDSKETADEAKEADEAEEETTDGKDDD
jgi:large subunit ribosomal protein L10